LWPRFQLVREVKFFSWTSTACCSCFASSLYVLRSLLIYVATSFDFPISPVESLLPRTPSYKFSLPFSRYNCQIQTSFSYEALSKSECTDSPTQPLSFSQITHVCLLSNFLKYIMFNDATAQVSKLSPSSRRVVLSILGGSKWGSKR
jgi:hypothetical protein